MYPAAGALCTESYSRTKKPMIRWNMCIARNRLDKIRLVRYLHLWSDNFIALRTKITNIKKYAHPWNLCLPQEQNTKVAYIDNINFKK